MPLIKPFLSNVSSTLGKQVLTILNLNSMATIKAFAHLNELTKDVTNDYYLTPEIRDTLYTEDIIQRISDKEIATKNVNGASFVDLFLKECIQAITEGFNVVTPLFRSSISIQGVIYDYDLGHSIAANRLNLSVNLSQGEEARKAIADVSVDVHKAAGSASPVIQSIMNPTRQVANVLNAGKMVLIQGLNIALRGEDEAIGITFTPYTEAEEPDRPSEISEDVPVFIAPDEVYPNTNTKLQFTLPADVTPGTWKVQIATQSSGNSKQFTKNVRTDEYSRVITVE